MRQSKLLVLLKAFIYQGPLNSLKILASGFNDQFELLSKKNELQVIIIYHNNNREFAYDFSVENVFLKKEVLTVLGNSFEVISN